MGKLTGTTHGDAANALFGFYQKKAADMEGAGQYYMAAVALALSVESAVLAYLLVEFGEDNGGELQIPDSVGMNDLIKVANEIDVLGAPIDVASHVREEGDETRPKHLAKDVVDHIRRLRNLVHPARALAEGFDPEAFSGSDLERIKEMHESIMHSLMYYI